MNFFQYQDSARRSTWRLVLLFVVAVISLVLLTNLVLLGALTSFGSLTIDSIDRTLFVQVSVAVVSTIGLVILFKWLQLRGGGRIVAEQMGGVLLGLDHTGLAERQLLNVMEEMAIAAGLPVPPVYLLEEQGINAFAAGYSGNDAVIGITRGALDALDRDQLQGVIGHEFSHILHGDTRLNLRLIAILAGILFIGQAGRVVLHSKRRGSMSGRRRSSGGLPLVVVALGLLAIGYVGVGVMLGNLIRAAVSRQREFLADASAVQYTRNPQGIAGALQVIAGSASGSQLHSGKAEENSHLFFGNALAKKASSAFATHPPVEQRIRRILPNWDGKYLQPAKVSVVSSTASSLDAGVASLVGAASSLAEHIDSAGSLNEGAVGRSQQCIVGLPKPLYAACQHPYYARALVFALLLARAEKQFQLQQLDLLDDGIRLRQRIEELLPEVARLTPGQRLPLIELLSPALKQQSFRQYQGFKEQVQQLIEADGKLDRFEWMLQRLLLSYLDSSYANPGRRGRALVSLQQASTECFELLSLVALQGHGSYYPAESAFYHALTVLGIGPARMVPEAQLSHGLIDKALDKVQRLRPTPKQQLLLACAACIEWDNQVTVAERELLQVVAVSLDCPMPVV